MQKENQSLQNQVLNHSRKNKTTVTVILVNGYRLFGRVLSFDRFTVLLEVKNKQNLIFKHAISTLVPSEEVDFSSEGED